ncbi:tail fiber assembly protein [Pseudomonas corrugata]|nr:tail fiber assembly protein [Pseudomonas corrugata]MBI6692341.1 tail fiber assembly protein [Pseudomonas corrugata]
MGELTVIFFSAAELGFYDIAINGDIPSDCVEVSRESHSALMDGQSAGMIIAPDETGQPILIDRPPPSPEALAAAERVWRDRQLIFTDPLISRHRDEVEEGVATTLTPEQYAELQEYRRALRGWPEAGKFPLIDHRPPPPSWLTGQIQ